MKMNKLYDTNNYEEFKLKIKIWKLLDSYTTCNMGTFMTQLCGILSKHDALTQFKHSFAQELLNLNLSLPAIQQINNIDLSSNTETKNDDNDNDDIDKRRHICTPIWIT
eukprot:158795_1